MDNQFHHKQALVSIITAELGLEFALERRFYDRRDLESIVGFIITNSHDLCVRSEATRRIDSLTLTARLLSYRNKTRISGFTNNKEFIQGCFEIIVMIKHICLSENFAILVKSIIRGLDPEKELETISLLEYLAITGLHESVPIQYFWNSLDDQPIAVSKIDNVYYDLQGEPCLLTESDISLLAYLEKLA
jgi:hypothetical protein